MNNDRRQAGRAPASPPPYEDATVFQIGQAYVAAAPERFISPSHDPKL